MITCHVHAHDTASACRYTPPGEHLPIATAIGSPNYGYRSGAASQTCVLQRLPALHACSLASGCGLPAVMTD
jgi:hypothetical protein